MPSLNNNQAAQSGNRWRTDLQGHMQMITPDMNLQYI